MTVVYTLPLPYYNDTIVTPRIRHLLDRQTNKLLEFLCKYSAQNKLFFVCAKFNTMPN